MKFNFVFELSTDVQVHYSLECFLIDYYLL